MVVTHFHKPGETCVLLGLKWCGVGEVFNAHEERKANLLKL